MKNETAGRQRCAKRAVKFSHNRFAGAPEQAHEKLSMPNPLSKKRILILTADAGFGHRRAAQAVAEALERQHPQACECTILNPVSERNAPFLLRSAMGNYDRTVTRWPVYYRISYALSDTRPACRLLDGAMRLLLGRLFTSLLEEFRPDAALSTYHIYNPPLRAAIDRLGAVIPLFSVATDLEAVHKMWLQPGPDRIFVASQAVRCEALANGLPGEQVIASGIPVNPRFAEPAKPKPDLRRELGWEEELTTLLAVGSRRVASLLAHLSAINQAGLPLQVAAVAGGDQRLLQELQAIHWRIPAHVYGFIDQMPELMRAADLLVSKAGGLIIAEGLACGLPLLLIETIPGQETGNVRFVQENRAGRMAASPRESAAILEEWLQDGGKGLREASSNARRAGRPRAACQVAESIWEIVQMR
jgi:1,2-diacylglycerol 3-beta-galactosyltransferase